MSLALRTTLWLLAGLATLRCTAIPAGAQDAAVAAASGNGVAVKSPVDRFRELLAMKPVQRESYLAGRTPEDREKILVKITEYEAMKPEDRELRLRMTQLRWYLLRFMPTSPTNRVAQLASIPDEVDRKMVGDRLETWDLLPGEIQQQVLTNETAARYFIGSSSPPQLDPRLAGLSAAERKDLIEKVNALDALPAREREQICSEFHQFFDLTAEEKQRTLGVLPPAEREQMETALAIFNQLPAEQRERCLASFDKFTGMSEPERALFLQNAEHWIQMSEADRRAWLELVSHLPEPTSALMPAGFYAPLPDGFQPPPPKTTN